ncbi:molybdate ABC transporter substrate-binding protein [Paenibacillus alkaliterrae]|uniref:molybdate ABC transporter substrate-binding protein n=1 Tax=Paenibacillus alkaliterrae TaxID=320909 RepID=UPI001F3516D7|nr:molybdate ABC transporter substrate-binding protein [Paenibacillus alkaliterrae]MCF2940514.1 molybdate ABC transporter substrate-binding protein [Paenibacillus alkaliterrae]
MLKLVKRNMILSVVLILSILLVACGAGSGSQTATSTQSPAANQASESSAETVELTISAGASLTDALNEIQTIYETKHNNIKLVFNFGASGALQQQIEQGAPADLFISAASKNMKDLVDKQLIDSAEQHNLLSNELVVVVPSDSKLSIGNEQDLKKEEVKKIAIGIPESVPAGKYAQEAITNANLWDGLQTKIVQAKDVRQVLQYAETGNVDAGFVYKTDALTSDKVKIAFTVDPDSYSPIHYPVGIVQATKHAKEAEEFYAFLQTNEALDVFVKYGFSIPK